MDQQDLCFATIEQLSNLFRSKTVSPVEYIQAQLDRISATEDKLNSFITITGEQALSEAKIAETDIMEERYKGPLHGISMGLKDLYYVKGIRNTSGIKVHDQFAPDYDSTVAARLKSAGAILTGKLNLAPLAMSGTGKNEFYGSAKNPWDIRMIPGGSSSGSGTATASGQCTVTMGSDTGGSIRIPASFCGIVGHKPTYGLVSRYGVSPLAFSLDHCGPMVRTVTDAALVMNAISGFDPQDPSSTRADPPDCLANLKKGIESYTIGVANEFWDVPVDTEIKESVMKAINLLSDLGATIKNVSWPDIYESVSFGHLISISEASNIHAKMARTSGDPLIDDVLYKYPRIQAGLFMSAADYLLAQQWRLRYTKNSRKVFDQVDVIVGPTLQMAAFPIGSTEIKVGTKVDKVENFVPTYTRPCDQNGFPAVTIPCGFTKTGLPIGLQIAGKPNQDDIVLRAAFAYEQAAGWTTRRPEF